MIKLKKILFFIALFFMIYLFKSCVFADSKDINFTYNDTYYVLTKFDNANYNSNTDAFIVIHTKKSDFNSFGAIVLKNAKTYINEGAIITVTKTGRTKFFALKTGDDYYNKLLSFYLFRYDMNKEKWGNWGGLMTESDALNDVSLNWTTIIKTDVNLFYDKDTIAFRNNWLVEPYIANTDSSLQNMSSDSLLIFPGDYLSDSYNLRFALRIIEDKGDYESETNLVRIELNSESPFYHNVDGDVFYEIPFTSFPDTVSLVSGQKYNWLLAYDDYGTNYINRYLVSNVDYQFTGSQGGRWWSVVLTILMQ